MQRRDLLPDANLLLFLAIVAGRATCYSVVFPLGVAPTQADGFATLAGCGERGICRP
jgi:hypothetical protein